MGKSGVFTVTLVLVLALVAVGQAFVFTDPTSLYSTLIWDHWVYQAHQSTPLITVFYGQGDYDLLYFEQLGQVQDASVETMADRSLALYAGPGGLRQFQLERCLQEINVAGQNGLVCGYSYEDEHGQNLWEYRIFVLLPGEEGFSMALSSDGPWVFEDSPMLEDILSRWRWLF